ncbi:hypothetical protein KDW_37510 [Dictyobacter vulcani]|uniref:Uncharacterized protein n=1 Tax=Dictyobacter vulcani TaxID=2607529 RepID=A0A5J4KU57_9CHLR|nr:hypothetical protein KDW_37510 [Dictyobacter vulcani]
MLLVLVPVEVSTFTIITVQPTNSFAYVYHKLLPLNYELHLHATSLPRLNGEI